MCRKRVWVKMCEHASARPRAGFPRPGQRQAGFPKVLAILVNAVLLTACSPGDATDQASAQPATQPPSPALAASAEPLPAPTWQDAASARYSGLFEAETITLVDGSWEGAPYEEGGASAPRAGLVEDFALFADLDDDGADETTVLLWTSGGGSGTFDYLAVLDRNEHGAVAVSDVAPLGDRVMLRKAFADSGWLVVETVEAGPDDAACCPGQKRRRSFVLNGAELTEVGRMDLGRLSLADLAGDWALVAVEPLGAVPDEVVVTARFDGDSISGAGGCNRYSGTIVAGEEAGGITIPGPLAATRMMCPEPQMEWEDRYLQLLQGVTRFSFRAGDLLLTSIVGDGGISGLRFRAVEPSPGTPETQPEPPGR